MTTTVYEDLVKAYGVENIYMLGSSYRSTYDDDYASFTYINAVDGSIHHDNWTTAAACPSYSRYEGPSLREGVEKGNITLYRAAEIMYERAKAVESNFSTSIYDIEKLPNIQFPCKVTTGRKFRGEGVVVGIRKVVSGPYETEYAKIFSDGEIHEAVLYRVEVPGDYIQNLYTAWRKQQLDSVDLDEVASRDLDSAMKFIRSFDADYETFKRTYTHKIIELEDTKSVEEIKAEEKAKAFKEKKLAELKVWVKEKINPKTEEEVETIALRIYNKRYN